MFKKICLLLLALAAINSFSQSSNKGWGIYTSMRGVKSVSLSGNNIWAASTGGLFNFNTSNTSSITKFTSLDGLLSNELNSGTVDLNGNIWVGATDGSINVYYPSDGQWKVVTDIRNSSEPNRKVNCFFQYGNAMYFATQFCIVKFSISQFQFVDQPYVFLGPLFSPKTPVNWIHIVNDTIWAATPAGIAYANVNTSLPIQSNWRNFTTTNSVLNRNIVNTITFLNNRVYFGTDSGMVYFQNGTLVKYEPLFNGAPLREGVNNMVASGNSLYFSSYRNSNRIYRADIGNINNAQQVYTGSPINSFKIGSNGTLWVGTQQNGVDRFASNTHNFISPDGPYSNLNFNIAVDQSSNVWAVSGSLGGEWSTLSGIYKYNGSSWTNYLAANYPAMGGGCCGWVLSYPDQYGDVWVAGFGNGLLKIHGNEMTRYTETNSILKEYGGAGFVLVQGIDEDNSGNLWVVNNRVQTNIINFTQQIGYPAPVGNPFDCHFTALVIDNYNTKWMPLHEIEGNVRGLMYFNENTNPPGGLIGYTSMGSNVDQLNDIAVDKNGEVWVATNNGVVIFPDPSQAINNPGQVPNNFKMRIIENGISTPLTESVLSIDVDALNNKWIGTFSSGVIYVSPDGSTLLKRFTTANSPLIDNRITTIESDKMTGIVYFGSDKGIVSYKTIAITPLTDCDKITVGPNPFVIPNSSPLRIDGLVEESTVKILTISGALVYEFETPGGRVTEWDGRDTYSNYVSSGIYIIVGYNKDGSKACTGKVAVVRK